MSRHVQPARARAADRRRPAMAAGFFLLAVLHPLPIAPPGGAATLEVLVQGEGAAAALAAVGGRPLVALPIFEKFHRVEDPMTMTTGGTGLGLYIARELTRAMGGEIEATSAPRRGSTFTVRLPLATAHDPSEPPPASTPERERTDAAEVRPPGPKQTRAENPLVRSS